LNSASNNFLYEREDDSTDYKNTSTKIAYAIISVRADGTSGQRKFKIYSAPTFDSKVAATEVFNSEDLLIKPASWSGAGEIVTSLLVPIQNNHYIVVENTSGAASLDIHIIQVE